jgi:RNA polymerase sigma-70 factor, ECF subfamily
MKPEISHPPATPPARPTFAEVYAQGADYVFRTLRRMGVAEADCPDATQEVFVVVHRRLPGYEPRERLFGWLAAIAANIAAQHRDRYRRTPLVEAGADPADVTLMPGSPGTSATPALDAEDAIATRELALLLLQDVEPERRLVLVLHHVDQMSTREIAEALAIPKGTADTRLRLAQQEFQAAFRRYEARASREHGCLAVIAAALVLATTSPAHAGPTVSADVDLGSSTKGAPTPSSAGAVPPGPSALYAVGFGLRAGYRFDLTPAWWLLPEIGAQYTVLRTYTYGDTNEAESGVSRVFGGGRAGWSGVLRPDLRIEPAVYGHAGVGWYHLPENGTAFDVGASIDLRIRWRCFVGVQLGYTVVTVWHPAGRSVVVVVPTGPVTLPGAANADANPWVSLGLHAGFLFW